MDAERIMERVRRLLAIANDPAASDNEQRIALEQAQRLCGALRPEGGLTESPASHRFDHRKTFGSVHSERNHNHEKGNTTKMYWERYIDRRNPRRIEPLDKPIDTYIMLDTETTGLHPEEGATLIEIGALFVQPGNENSRPKFEQLIDPQHPLTEFITGLTGITDRMLQGMPTAGAAMMRFHQWIDHVWPAGEPLTIIAHNAQFDVSFLDVAERVYDPTSPVFDCKWACTKEMSWELNPQKRHHRVADLIVDYHIGDVEEHRALSDAIQEQMLYQALCAEATRRGKWNERED